MESKTNPHTSLSLLLTSLSLVYSDGEYKKLEAICLASPSLRKANKQQDKLGFIIKDERRNKQLRKYSFWVKRLISQCDI
jgi:hypothetical protein